MNDRSLHGTKKVEVDNYDKTCQILEAVGLEAKSYQETKRETWPYKNCEITLDSLRKILNEKEIAEIEWGDYLPEKIVQKLSSIFK